MKYVSMKILLEGCKHTHVARWGSADPLSDPDEELFHVTCLICYQRLVTTADRMNRVTKFSADAPAPMCSHTDKEPIPKDPKFNRNFMDAMCTACGSVLRHPEGAGTWDEVLFNGFLIAEQP